MTKADQDQSDAYPEAEAAAREAATLKRLLATPHKPVKAIRGKRVESQSK